MRRLGFLVCVGCVFLGYRKVGVREFESMAQKDWNPRSMVFVSSTQATFHSLAVTLGPDMDCEEYTEW